MMNEQEFAEWLCNRYAAISQEVATFDLYEEQHHAGRLIGQQRELKAVADYLDIDLEATNEPAN
ncbi:MAG: hypothetical protein ACLFWB_08395 [Armatimonadota bacterium]